MNKIVVFILAVATVGIFLAGPVSALTRSEVEKNLICYACPGEPLNIDRCSGGDKMRAEIDRRLALGQDKETIVNYFAGIYGEEILTVPPKKGFNLVAYAAPFAGLLIGLALAAILAWKWAVAGRKSDGNTEHGTDLGEIDRAMKEKIENELNKLEND